jgi:uncharacterized membrane protein
LHLVVTDGVVKGERRWPMASAVLLAGLLRILLPPELRLRDARPLFIVVLLVLIVALMVGDPGRIDRQKTWLRVLTGTLIGLITLVNSSSAARLVVGIFSEAHFAQSAGTLLVSGAVIWLTNVIAFGLWYWDLDRGGAAARALGTASGPAFVFPEMTNAEHVPAGWYPKFVDYLHLSFSTATAFSPTDVSAIKPWAKLMMMAEEIVSLVVGLLVIARAVNVIR